MANIVDFRTARLDKDGRIYHKDENGDVWFPYIFEYRHKEKLYGITLWARTVDEAQEVKCSVQRTLKFSGEIIQEIEQ